MQRLATRLPLGINRPSYTERLLHSNLTTFEARRRRGDLILTYKSLHGSSVSNLSGLFVQNSDTRLRGHQFKLAKENFKILARQFFLSNRVFDDWNNLPTNVVSAPSVNAFKNLYDAHLQRVNS